MSSRTLARLKQAERATRTATAPAAEDDALARAFAARHPRTAEFILLADESPLLQALMNRLDVNDFHARSAWNWLLAPYTGWATEPERYDLPAVLLEFLAAPAPPHWAAIQACTACGLKVPRLTHPSGEQPFSICPACGSPTDQRAIFGPPGTEGFASGLK